MNRDDWRPPPAQIHGEQQNDALPSRTAACCQPHGHSQQAPAVTHAERYVQNLSGLYVYFRSDLTHVSLFRWVAASERLLISTDRRQERWRVQPASLRLACRFGLG